MSAHKSHPFSMTGSMKKGRVTRRGRGGTTLNGHLRALYKDHFILTSTARFSSSADLLTGRILGSSCVFPLAFVFFFFKIPIIFSQQISDISSIIKFKTTDTSLERDHLVPLHFFLLDLLQSVRFILNK